MTIAVTPKNLTTDGKSAYHPAKFLHIAGTCQLTSLDNV